jgi:tetratricopeptide (TPR) repeat protein
MPGLARERWNEALEEANSANILLEMKEFHLDAIAYLLPPSEFSLEQIRQNLEECGGCGPLKRYVALLYRLGRIDEARKFLDAHAVGNNPPIGDGELTLLKSLVLSPLPRELRRDLLQILSGCDDDGWRAAAMRILVEHSRGEDDAKELLRTLISSPEPVDAAVCDEFNRASLCISLRCSDWQLARAIICKLFRSGVADPDIGRNLRHIWLWLTVECLPTNFEEILADLPHMDDPDGNILRRALFMPIARSCMDSGNFQLAARFLDCIGIDETEQTIDEIALRMRVAMAVGQFAAAFELIRKFYGRECVVPTQLLFDANEQFMGSAVATRWNGWLGEFFSAKAGKIDGTTLLRGMIMVAKNYIVLGNVNSAVEIVGAIGGEEIPLEIEAALQFLRLQLAMARDNEGEANEILHRLRSTCGDSDEAIETYFLRSDYFNGSGRKSDAADELHDFLDAHGDCKRVPEALLKLANLHRELGNSAAAFAILEEISDGNSSAAICARLLEGDILRELNDFAAAENVYRSILRQFSDGKYLPFAQLRLAECLLASQSLDAVAEAVEILEWLAAEKTHDPNFAAEIDYVYAMALRRSGDCGGTDGQLLRTADRECDGALDFRGRYWISQ